MFILGIQRHVSILHYFSLDSYLLNINIFIYSNWTQATRKYIIVHCMASKNELKLSLIIHHTHNTHCYFNLFSVSSIKICRLNNFVLSNIKGLGVVVYTMEFLRVIFYYIVFNVLASLRYKNIDLVVGHLEFAFDYLNKSFFAAGGSVYYILQHCGSFKLHQEV